LGFSIRKSETYSIELIESLFKLFDDRRRHASLCVCVCGTDDDDFCASYTLFDR